MINRLKRADREQRFLIINGLISIVLLISGLVIARTHTGPPRQEMIRAAVIMDSSLQCVSDWCRERNINMNPDNDPRNTGLIGPELSEITTTAGDLAAKRTTINPNFAALIVNLLMEAGVEKGDTIAIACSGSFPALMIATMAASRAMELEARVILSLGASSFGASNIDFTILDIYRLLQDKGLIINDPSVISLGGDSDVGTGFDDGATDRLLSSNSLRGLKVIRETRLETNIGIRDSIYFAGTPGGVKAFISSGGSQASLGTSTAILDLPPGLVRKAAIPPKNQRGMVHSMLARGIPVIHLLYIRGLARQYHIEWDPPVQPEFSSRYYFSKDKTSPLELLMAGLFILYFGAILIGYRLFQNR